jgi:hypothetical protein
VAVVATTELRLASTQRCNALINFLLLTLNTNMSAFFCSLPRSCVLYVQIEACMLRGPTLEGLRRMLLLALLQDAAPLGPGPLLPSDLLPLEELLLVVPSNQAEMLLSVVPNLLRMINSGAGMIQGDCCNANVGRLWGKHCVVLSSHTAVCLG